MTQVSRKGFVDKNGQQVAIVPKVPGATSGNLASFDENGDLQDSGKKPTDFAPASGSTEYAAKNHGHVEISDFTGTNGSGASVKVGENPGAQGEGVIKLTVKGDGQGTQSDSAEVNYDNIGNLQRALEAPAAPASGGTSPITNGLVYEALLKQCGSIQVTRAADGTSFDIDNDFHDVDYLESFIANYVEDVEYPVKVTLWNASTSEAYTFHGLASWHDNVSQSKVRVRLKLHTMLLTAVCSYSGSYGTSNTWAASWTVIDQSSMLQLVS